MKLLFLILVALSFPAPSLAVEYFCETAHKKAANEILATKSPLRAQLPSKEKAQFEKYLRDTANGLEVMRGENGLVMDTVSLKQNGKGNFKKNDYKTEAAPTDMALDLLAQAGLSEKPEFQSRSHKNLDKVLQVLGELPRHPETGLFFRLYETKGKDTREILQRDVSSVDNMHLALALWTVAEQFQGTPRGEKARELFNQMDFSTFVDEKSGWLGGNLKSNSKEGKTTWELEPYRYHFGSEARSAYLAGYALGLFRNPEKEALLVKGMQTVPIETKGNKNKSSLLVWDGGVFQSLLPRLLLNEEIYSPRLLTSAKETGKGLIRDAIPVQPGLKIPAGFSAAVTEIKRSEDGKIEILYDGKVGNPRFQSRQNPDLTRQDLVTTHAIFLGASTNPLNFAPTLSKLENLKSGDNKFYLEGFGWVDSVRVEGPENQYDVNSAGVGVDKGIEAIALLQILDPQGLSVSGKAITNNEKVKARLQSLYRVVESRWER